MSVYSSGAASITSEDDAKLHGATDCELWLKKIQTQQDDETEKQWRDEARAAVAVFEAVRDNTGVALYSGRPVFNIFHSNVETMVPAVYNSTPIPDVRRKFGDRDPVARLASQIAERALDATLDSQDIDTLMKAAVRSALTAGWGNARVRYRAEVDGDRLIHEEVRPDLVRWDKVVRGPGGDHNEVPWWAFPHDMTKREIAGLLRFAEHLTDEQKDERLRTMPFGGGAKDQDGTEQRPDRGVFRTARIWEVWDKDSKAVIFFAEADAKLPLLVEHDPLGVSTFFPMPKPLQAIHRVSGLTPVCPHNVYADLVDEIESVTRRIKGVVSNMRTRALADPKLKQDIEKLTEAGDSEVVSASAAELFGPTGVQKLEDLIAWWPVEQDVKVLQQLIAHRESVKQIIYEVTGISDILRGATQASETATAQQIKATWGSQRVQELQAEVARYARDLLRMMAEVIFNKFDDQTIRNMTLLPEPVDRDAIGAQAEQQIMAQIKAQQQQAPQQVGPDGQPLPQEPAQPDPQMIEAAKQQAIAQAEQLAEQQFQTALGVLRSQLRWYRVDIETDSTIKANLVADQEQVASFVGMTAQFFGAAAQMAQVAPEMLPPMTAIWSKIATKSYKLGKGADEIMDKIVDAANQAVANGMGKQQSGPSPEELEHERAMQEAQRQHEAQMLDAKRESDAMKQAHDQTLAGMKQADAERQAAHDAEMTARQQDHDQFMAAHEQAMALFDAHRSMLDSEATAQVESLKQAGAEMKAKHANDAAERKAKLQKALPPGSKAA